MTPDPAALAPALPQRWQDLRPRHVLLVIAGAVPVLGFLPFLAAILPH